MQEFAPFRKLGVCYDKLKKNEGASLAKAAFHTFSTFWLRQIDQLQYQRTPRDNAHTTWQEVSTHNILQYRTFASRLATNDNYLWKIDTLATSTVENILQLVDNWYQLLHRYYQTMCRCNNAN